MGKSTSESSDAATNVLLGMLGRYSIDEACSLLAQMMSPQQVRAARQEIERRVSQIRILRDPPTLESHEVDAWYAGPSDHDRFWPPYRDMLEKKGWDGVDIEKIDSASTKIVSLLHYPHLGAFQTRGLTVGYVQSGKTANFTAVIAKAADAGYRMFVVLSGLTNKLRKQTQDRLDAELRNLNPELWISLTTSDLDFRGDSNANAFLTRYSQQKTFAVLKKHPARLQRLLDWLRSAHDSVIRNCPVLVIDDEADQASINTRDRDDRTPINSLVVQILQSLPKVAYIGYTATPFANVFIDPDVPEDLYPRHFIVDLPRPDIYFGSERLFGRDRITFDEHDEDVDGLDVIRSITDDEAHAARPSRLERAFFDLDMSRAPALRDSLHYFWMATAARWSRGQSAKHSSMLVHTSQYADVHHRVSESIHQYSESVRSAVRDEDRDLLARFEKQWQQEQQAVDSAQFGLTPVPFSDVRRHLSEVLDACRNVVENYLAAEEDRLVYGDEAGTFVVVGGNILARGLTLEGLVSSYFVRSANAYDTLLQMGRWFGYRPGYEDLPRLWMTDELQNYFFELATVEREIRFDIARYEKENLTPTEFAPRIRTHPQLAITSRLKMQRAVEAAISYGDQHPQTILFHHNDREWLLTNQQAAAELIEGIVDQGLSFETEGRTPHLARHVPASLVERFLRSYRFHPDSWNLRADLMRQYIAEENERGSLQLWSVAVLSGSRNAGPPTSLGPIRVAPMRRTRLKSSSAETANLKAIMSRSDMVADLPQYQNTETANRQWHQLAEIRNIEEIQTAGLLLLYPISKDSAPEPHHKNREPLAAVADLIGCAFVFPRSMNPGRGVRYLTADLSSIEQDEVPIWDEDEEDLR